jgi:hypothetical protein
MIRDNFMFALFNISILNYIILLYFFYINLEYNIFNFLINDFALCNLIWVYNVNTNSLVEGSPFKTKSSCARIVPIERHTISSYLDNDKIFKYQWIFSSSPLDLDYLSKFNTLSIIQESLVSNNNSLIGVKNSISKNVLPLSSES